MYLTMQTNRVGLYGLVYANSYMSREIAVEVQTFLDVKQEYNDDSLILRFTFYIIKYVRPFTL